MALQYVVNRLKRSYQARKANYSGQQVEQLAAKYLTRHQLRVLAFNYRCRRGEIDIIMLDGETIVFVEVRYRRSNSHGTPLETVDFRKQQKLLITAEHYLQQHFQNAPCRFDVISAHCDPVSAELCFDWVKNAFSY
ncbi:YraN family protein [Dasania marina]|uniref:YraN family protein n=1 Tax=Dasania marina TaxID=471499 RepID=UPI00038196AD|nr:YraN family protein [Dasania marina]